MKIFLFSILFFAFLTPVFSQDHLVVGYLPYYRFALSDNIEYEKLTHLCLAFVNPDAQGNLDIGGENIQPIVDAAHDADVIVLLSLAGGALTAEWASNWANLTKSNNRSAFIHKIVNYVNAHELQGVDVDLEWDHVDENYSGFVLELRDSMDVYNMLMTAALPGTTRYAEITDEAMHSYDFINLMAYDLTGSWAPNNPGPHSPYFFAVQSINYWKAQGMSGENLTLGLPFYGYDFSNPPAVPAFTFGSMVVEDEDYAFLDQVGQRYYNGIPTIQAKTELGNLETSGVCIWELGQDAFNEYSLLSAVWDVSNGAVNSSGVFLENNLAVYPNPFFSEINLTALLDGENIIQLISPDGQLIHNWKVNHQSSISLNLPNLQNGIYFLNIYNRQENVTKRIFKLD